MIGEVEGVLDNHYLPNFGEDNQKESPGIPGGDNNVLHPNYDHYLVKDIESVQFKVMIENLRMPESENEVFF